MTIVCQCDMAHHFENVSQFLLGLTICTSPICASLFPSGGVTCLHFEVHYSEYQEEVGHD